MKTLPGVVFSLLLLVPLRAQNPAPPPAPASPNSIVAPSSIDPAKAAEIKKMLKITGMNRALNLMMEQMFDAFKKHNPTVSPKTWERLQANMNVNELIENIIPLYDKYYSLADLKAANAFYGSPAGQHILSNMPQLMYETRQVGQAWGRKTAQQVEEQIQAEHAAPSSTAAPTPAPAPDNSTAK
jgi:hypothetical protein